MLQEDQRTGSAHRSRIATHCGTRDRGILAGRASSASGACGGQGAYAFPGRASRRSRSGEIHLWSRKAQVIARGEEAVARHGLGGGWNVQASEGSNASEEQL